MKKIIFSLSLVFALVSCDPSAKDFNQAITTSVNNAEILVTEHDANVMWALENNRTDSIVPLTKTTLGQIVKEIERIQSVALPKNGESLKSASESYLDALMNFVKTQSAYADYTSGMADENANIMDKNNSEAVKKLEIARKRYEEYRNAFTKAKGITR